MAVSVEDAYEAVQQTLLSADLPGVSEAGVSSPKLSGNSLPQMHCILR